MADKPLKVTLIKSLIGVQSKHRASAKGLGFRKLNTSVVVASTPENLGMIRKISYLLKVEAQ